MEKDWIFSIGPINFDGTVFVMTVLTCLIVFGLVFWMSRQMTIKPTKRQNALEYIIEMVEGIFKDNVGASEARRFTLLGFVLFLFLIVANNIGLVTKLENPEGINLWKSPTANVAITMTLSLIVILLSNYLGVKQKGFKGYLKGFATPIGMTPMNILDELINFMSLGLRLYGNIFAGEALLSLIAQLGNTHVALLPVAVLLEVAWTGFSVFISCVQAYVFILLTGVYISHKISVEH